MKEDLNDDLKAWFDCLLGDWKLVEEYVPWMFSEVR